MWCEEGFLYLVPCPFQKLEVVWRGLRMPPPTVYSKRACTLPGVPCRNGATTPAEGDGQADAGERSKGAVLETRDGDQSCADASAAKEDVDGEDGEDGDCGRVLGRGGGKGATVAKGRDTSAGVEGVPLVWHPFATAMELLSTTVPIIMG